jgi:hypothetical protein
MSVEKSNRYESCVRGINKALFEMLAYSKSNGLGSIFSLNNYNAKEL